MAEPLPSAEAANAAKQTLRRHYRTLRQAVAQPERLASDEAINGAVVSFIIGSGARTVAAFSAFDGEPDLAPALSVLVTRGVNVVLPVVSTDSTDRGLVFRRWDPQAATRDNHLGIAEPETDARPASAGDIDVMLMPLVAWDESGGRLGMGSGDYDRTLASFASRSRPRRIGVAYRVQQADQFPCDRWDIPLHGVITEQGLFTCRR